MRVSVGLSLLSLALAVFALPRAVEAQQAGKAPRVGLLPPCPGPDSVFGATLRDLGYTWGKTITFVCARAERDYPGDYRRLSDATADLLAQNVDAIVALTHITAHAAHRATRAIPIVMIASGDPVATGLVASLRRPGGNVTGLTYYAAELVEKRLQLLQEMVPGITSIAALGNPESDHVLGLYRKDAERTARALGLQLLMVDVSHPRDLGRGIDTVVKRGARGLLVLTDPMLAAHTRQIIELASQHRLPAIYWAKSAAEAGGLAAYSADYEDLTRRAAYYLNRILRGARPAELPVEQPTRFELVINLRTARALGLTIPPSLLLRADRVIE
jgi:putative ABC transport system substrate-binding protein